MPRGKRKQKIIAEAACGQNRKVYAKFWVETGLFDIALPDRATPGFHLRHIKGLTVDEARALHETLCDLKKQGAFQSSS